MNIENMDVTVLLQLKTVVLIFLLGVLHILVKCSRVLDSQIQQELFVPDYCKRVGVCPEGTHVMCTHFNPNRTKGPLCAGSRNETITPEYAKLILDLLNLIRSRSAYGKTVGLANLPLPRAYGLYRLQWDPELSTLAQVWANTCIVSFDACHATKRFSDPGQLAGLTRFDADWIPIDARGLFNYTGFSLEKVKYGIHSTLRSWYRTKKYVHPDDITNTDDLWPRHLCRNVFLNIVHGRSTHVGCGISIFEEFDYYASAEHKVKLVHNVVRVVCNLSARLIATPRKDRVYTVDPPTQVGYTAKCGCPVGFDEDEDCLCYRSDSKLPFSCKNKECKPAIVVMPIIKVEKAPLENVNTELRKVRISNRKLITNEIDTNHQQLDNTRARRHNLRGSIFLKPSVFELPPRKLKNTDRFETKPFNMGVNLRGNNSTPHNLARRTNVKKSLSIGNLREMASLEFHNITKSYHNIGNIQEANRIKSTRGELYNENANPNKNFDVQLSNNKVMTLLNELEEEAKIVQVPCDKKDILDNKIRKIYKAFVDKAFPLRETENGNAYRYRTQNFNDFSKNDSLHKYEEQFNTLRQPDLNKINGKNHTPSKQGYNEHFMKINLLNELIEKPQNYTSSDELLDIRNIHDYRKMKQGKSNDFKKEKSLSHREDDILTIERRKFYEDKLNNLERRLRNEYSHGSKNKVYNDQHQRRMLSTNHEHQQRNGRLNFNRFLDF